jgi:hypothetical protein
LKPVITHASIAATTFSPIYGRYSAPHETVTVPSATRN